MPELIVAALDDAGVSHATSAVDLGCGTGLMGAALRSRVTRLEGWDISAAMLQKARARGIYDRLGRADLHALRLDPASADLVVAADVFMYVGALEGVFATVAQALAPLGVFAFSVEAADAGSGFVLLPTRRYAHAPDYVEGALAGCKLGIVSISRQIIRTDRKAPIEGLIVVAREAR